MPSQSSLIVAAPRRPAPQLAGEAVVRFAEALAPHLLTFLPKAVMVSPWLNTGEAAAYLRCSESRVRKLTMIGDIPSHREGGRRLYHRDKLDEFVRAGGAVCP